jgi:hypothetical protein
MVDYIVVGAEDPVRQPVVSQELPDVLCRIEFRTFCRQRDDGDIGRDGELVRHVPAGAIDDESGVRVWGDVPGDLGKMQIHREGVAAGQDERCALAFLGTDGAEDVGRCGALIMWRAGSRSSFGPSTRDLVLLADASLVGEPDFDLVDGDAFFSRDFLQACWELFLKSSIAPSACA